MPKIKELLIAPCGMNCALCAAYLARKNKLREKGVKIIVCDGCRIRAKKCAFLKKRCKLLLNKKVNFCYECKKFPCVRLQTIDKRYKENYHMSMVDNLKNIKKSGIDRFLKEEEKKWKCKKCGENICCHNGLCFKCNFNELKAKKKKYKWGE